ncbi:uncharacterized protein LOC128224621 [Mya arenaria]|uniref:uncharacterized protein LOC128224621 n=1 Tax=Mya arenaria TaxID=6604 RepID=UPI0022E424D7|nr:uncharacterized protein LOC128224621 [Mya arenaria]
MSAGPKPTKMERGSGKFNCIHSKTVAVALKRKNHAVICIVASIILTLIFLVFIIMWSVIREPLTMSKESLACIPCNKMEHSSNKNLDPAAGIKRRDDGMCCGSVESIAQMLFQKEMAVQYYYSSSSGSLIDMAEVYADCERETNDKQPIAKVVGIVECTPSYIVEGHYKVLWNKNGRTFYANNCVHLQLEGEIFVRKAGYYIVSSQLNLRRRRSETNTPINETRPTTFSHHVDLLSHMYGTTGVLMQTKKSIEINGVHFTSFLSAVFKLNKYDRLSVSVSHPELLDFNNPNDHFLVYYTYDQPN